MVFICLSIEMYFIIKEHLKWKWYTKQKFKGIVTEIKRWYTAAKCSTIVICSTSSEKIKIKNQIKQGVTNG